MIMSTLCHDAWLAALSITVYYSGYGIRAMYLFLARLIFCTL